MRCPDCETIIEVPEAESIGERLNRVAAERASSRGDDDDDYDRPRRNGRRKSSGSKLWLWLLLGGGIASLFCCGGPIALIALVKRSDAEQSPVPLMQALAGFQTKITKPQFIADGPAGWRCLPTTSSSSSAMNRRRASSPPTSAAIPATAKSTR